MLCTVPRVCLEERGIRFTLALGRPVQALDLEPATIVNLALPVNFIHHRDLAKLISIIVLMNVIIIYLNKLG